ncbi:hypothetical protein C8A00DRAFT_33628 [Chaetomidium leptoderma]|uniref:DUF6603 domain-containing protein n=1 Tax=Chaetomidium leptoderma TaxID=669021 RepID=A0AAN6ZX69_9PEZI|nr:hypothetical protein C8A00DRAFT_33628 [Chaetomidium leptoderma]
MSNSSWQVQSFHVNVGNGDCSIHVLEYQPSLVQKALAYKCVLIDGGSAWLPIDVGTKTAGTNPLRDMIARLNTLYRWANGHCQFDTIVLTHWDEDHYGNLLQTIKEDAAVYGGFPPYLQYTNDNLQLPLTYFYVPNWHSGTGLNGPSWYYLRAKKGYAYINRRYERGHRTTAFDFVPFAILRAADLSLKNVLGAEFFFNTLCRGAISDVQDLSSLVKANPPTGPYISPTDTTPPSMYCIGVCQVVPGTPSVSVIKEDPTRTNKFSIACIILWTDTWQISHYGAGDADQDTENRILGWLTKSHSGIMTSVKISHHGSRSSTPLNLFPTAKPRNIVMSIPSGMHRHPKVVWHLWLWAVSSGSSPAVLGTKYPHFFAVHPAAGGPYNLWYYTKADRVSVSFLERWDQTKYAPYWKDCNTRGGVINTCMASGQSVQSILCQYWAIKQAYGLDEDQMRPFVVNQLEKVWLTMCHPSPVSHPSVGQGYVWPTRVPITRSNQIQAVRIQSRNDGLDGLVFHLYRGQDLSFPYFGPFTRQSRYSTGVIGTLANGAAIYTYFFPWHLEARPAPGVPVSPKAGGSADAQDFYSESAAVVAGREADPPGTDLNEDDDVLPDAQDVGEGTPPPSCRLPPPRAVQARALAGEDNNGYYLYASIVSAAAISVAAAQYSILSAGPLNSFLSVLHCANLCLVGPNPPGPTGGTTPLLESDEFGHYLTAALQAQAVSAINAPQSYVGGFSFAVAPISGSPSDKAVLSFTTAAVEDAFGLARGTGPPMGILEDVKTLVFGLDTSVWDPTTTTGTATASLAQLVQFADITYLEKSPAVAYLSDMQLAIPPSATGKRNAVWFEPLSSYRTTTRLEMDLSSDAVGRLNKYVAAFAGLSIVSAFAIARRTSIWTPAAPQEGPEGTPASASATISYGGSLTFGGDFAISSGTHFDAAIELMPTQISLVLVLRDKVDILADIFTLLKPILGLQGDHFEFLDWLKATAGSTSFQLPYLRRIIADMDDDSESKGGTSSTPGIASVQIDLETCVNFSGGAFALFLITYTWTREAGGTSSSQLEAELWPAPLSTDTDTATYSPTLLPGYEGYRSLLPPVTLGPNEQWPLSLDLTKMGGFDHLPSEINPEVTQATLLINSSGISFSGDVVAGSPNGDIPKVSLAQLNLDASYLFGPAGGFSGSLDVMALIQAAPTAKNGLPAQITGEVWNDGTGWKLGAGVHNLYGSTLYQFFDSDTQGGIGPVLDNLEIRELVIEYDYHPSGGASSFSISGDIAFGTIALSLAFTCASPSSWEFKAALDTSEVPETGTTTLGQVLHQIFGEGGVEDDLPDCILDVPVNPPQSEDAVGLEMVRVAGPAGSTGSGLFFTAWLQFDGMAFQALQYQGPTPPGASKRPPPPRRLFTMAVSSLPTANVPLVGDITQPFDDMLLMYVQRLDAGDGADAGITYAELQTINTELATAKRSQLLYRVTKKTYADTDVVLPVGAHFLLVLKDDNGQPQVVLDYVFWTPALSFTTRTATLTVRKDETPAIIRTPREMRGQDSSSADPGTAKTPCEKKMGPLTIHNIGFKYSDGKEPTLSILMDASVVLGPIGLGLVGFSLDLHFTKGMTLLQLPTPGVSLGGLAVSFDRSPVVLGGMFEHFVVSKPGPPPVQLDYYQGAAALSFEPYLFQADGYYGETVSAAGKFKSAFVYFVLGGPLVTLELAQIDDVTGGFGYNTSLHLPTVTNVEQFPFLQGLSGTSSSSSTDPNTALASLTNSGWFFPRGASFWLAAGLHMLALEMLQASAVVVVEWNPDIVLGVFGVATADMPAGNSSAKLVHVELGLVGTFTFKDGTLKIEGQLAPSSFVLDPACHVTGGFALYQWFGGGGGGADGDFVFTVGGYHRGFNPPAQYPHPPRLAISWTLDDALSIRGEAYFAMTPNLCMAGGRLDASLSLGPLLAWFDAYADMLINFRPFFFSADGGVSVGVGFALNLWICTIHISCEVAANLHLQGPSIAGTVYVNFWVFGFSIEFGSSQDTSGRDKPLPLPDFYRLALQADLSQQKGPSPLLPRPAVSYERDDAMAEDSDLPPPHVYTCNEGLVPSGNAASMPSAPDEQWHVRGAVFQFTVGLRFAIDKATVVTTQTNPSAPAIPPFDVPLAGDPVYARPMHLTEPLSSAITVTITPPKGTSPNQPRWDVASGVVKAVPKGLWGAYSPETDPLNPSTANPNRIPAILNPSNAGGPSSPNATLTRLTMALTVSSPAPALSKDWIPAFDYADYFNRDAGSGNFPARNAADPVFYPVPILSPAAAAAEWEVVRSQWAGVPRFGAGAGEKAVEVWMGLGFAKERWRVDSGKGGGNGPPMTGAAPTGILLVEGVFDELYLEAPRTAGYGC